MRERYHRELDELKEEVVAMSVFARGMLTDGVEALRSLDGELAEKVIAKKRQIVEMDERIEEDALRLIALHQPMAGDLRLIAAALKMNTYLARICRYGYDIARVARDTLDLPHVARLVSIPGMSRIVSGMIADVTEAFRTGETKNLATLHERDDEVDAMRYAIFRECLTYMMEDPRTIKRCTDYIMVSRYLERCADHACKMGEKVHYMVTGEHVEIK